MKPGKLFLIVLLIASFGLITGSVLETETADSAAPSPCAGGFSGNFPCNKVRLQAQLPLGQFGASSGSNVWGYVDLDDNREYAIIGLNNGTAVIDLKNPTAPRVVGRIPGLDSRWREVKVYSFRNSSTGKWDAYAYVTTEAIQGLQIIDLSKLPVSVSLARTDHEISTSHTAFVANVDFATGVAKPGLTPFLYVEGADNRLRTTDRVWGRPPGPKPKACSGRACGTGIPGAYCSCGSGCSCMSSEAMANKGFHAFSLQNPRDPKIVGSYTTTYMHDVYVETFFGARAAQCAPGHNPCEVVFGWTGSDFRIIDFTDKSSPRVLSTLRYENLGYPHSGWISRNKLFLFSFDELDEVRTGLRTRVLTIKIDNFRRPEIKARWSGTSSAIEHNGYVVGNKLYISSYTKGLTILDTTNPTNPREIASFDTHPESDTTQFAGAWGAYPFLPSGNILVSDMNRGLFILKEEP